MVEPEALVELTRKWYTVDAARLESATECDVTMVWLAGVVLV